jgi:hypothetical protein
MILLAEGTTAEKPHALFTKYWNPPCSQEV